MEVQFFRGHTWQVGSHFKAGNFTRRWETDSRYDTKLIKVFCQK